MEVWIITFCHIFSLQIIWELSGDVMEDLNTPLLDILNRKLSEPATNCADPFGPLLATTTTEATEPTTPATTTTASTTTTSKLTLSWLPSHGFILFWRINSDWSSWMTTCPHIRCVIKPTHHQQRQHLVLPLLDPHLPPPPRRKQRPHRLLSWRK